MSYHPLRQEIVPPLVKNLLIINGIMFLATIAFNQAFNYDLNDLLGLHYFGSEKFQWHQLITYMFMHGSLNHLLSNMFSLWMFGCMIERKLGQQKFLIYYIVTGASAALLHYVIFHFENVELYTFFNDFMANPTMEVWIQLKQGFPFEDYLIHGNADYDLLKEAQDLVKINSIDPTQVQPFLNRTAAFVAEYSVYHKNLAVLVGASGSVFGILLAFGMLFPNMMMIFPIPMKVKYFVILYGLYELYSGVSQAGDGIAHYAHLGGMIFGFILLKIWSKK